MAHQTSIDFDAATMRKEQGIKSSADHANADEEGWTHQALGMLTAFANFTHGEFLIEDARTWAEQMGLPQPDECRAWGAVTRMAVARKRIEKVGYGNARSSNNSPKTLWKTIR